MLKLIFGEDSELIQFYCKNAYLSLNEPKYNISALKFAADHLQKCGNLCLNVKGVNVGFVIFFYLVTLISNFNVSFKCDI